MTIAPKILVADDDQALSRTLSWILKENGYEVLTVPGGEHLFDHLSAEQFDLLLLDIMMPKVDGLQLLQILRAGRFRLSHAFAQLRRHRVRAFAGYPSHQLTLDVEREHRQPMHAREVEQRQVERRIEAPHFGPL